MTFDIVSIFPAAFRSYLGVSILARAQSKQFITVRLHDLRSYTADKHRTVDDRPFGGGVGMVMRPDIVQKAITDLRSKKWKVKRGEKCRLILLTPQGKTFTQATAVRLVRQDRLILLSGRYEGFDERIRAMVDEEISLGDFILTGGELPALAVVDAVSRLIPGVLGKPESLSWESFDPTPEFSGYHIKSSGQRGSAFRGRLLEHPQYTKPRSLRVGKKDMKVPGVLLQGDHLKIFNWRLAQSLKKTKKRRPDLLAA